MNTSQTVYYNKNIPSKLVESLLGDIYPFESIDDTQPIIIDQEDSSLVISKSEIRRTEFYDAMLFNIVHIAFQSFERNSVSLSREPFWLSAIICDDVREKTELYGIKEYIYRTIMIAKRAFENIRNIHVSFERDQEIENEWFAINITVDNDVESFYVEYKEYVNCFIDAIPPAIREKICLSYNVI